MNQDEESKTLLRLGVIGVYPKADFKCQMCQETKWSKSINWRGMGWHIKPKEMRELLRICLICAKREHGPKNRLKLKDLIKEFENGKRVNDLL